MADSFSMDWARDAIDKGVGKAQSVMEDPEQINTLLNDLQEKLKELPGTVATAFDNVPLMASMVKSYVTREYTEVSPKVVVSLVSAFLYLVAQKDLIPDNVPVVGLADDVAVATIAMVICEPELKAYAAWREANAVQKAADANVAPEVAALDSCASVEKAFEVIPSDIADVEPIE